MPVSSPAIDLELHGYRTGGPGGLWVRGEERPEAFAYNDGDEYETWVGRTVRAATDVSVLSRELRRGVKDWPSLYHLSSQRANIVRPFLDTMQGPVLEIGAGMGAVTRAIGEAGHEVVAVEGSPRRAAICADRCRDLPNVQVVADTVQGFGSASRFGTIVVIGVLEYSRVYGFRSEDGRDPVDLMLEHLAGLLAPGGQLLLAIENQLGLKYFAGFPEDHVGRRMFGIEDRYGADTVVTFGRSELGGRLSRAGLDAQEWFYPFPDYKLPTAVVSERALDPDSAFDPSPLVVGSARSDHQRPTTTALHLERSWRTVHRNGLVADLANSFLVRASATPSPGPAALAWHFGGDNRRPEFAKVTTFEPDGDGVVVRRRRSVPSAPQTVGTVGIRLEDETCRPGRPWTAELEDVTARPGWRLSDLSDWFRTWFEAFSQASDAGADVPDDPTVPGHLVDALPRNLMVSGDTSSFIDLEWYSTEPCPRSYVVFRALYDSLASLAPVAPPAPGTPMVLRDLVVTLAAGHGVELDDDRLAAHWAREAEFQATVTGADLPGTGQEALAALLPVHRDLDEVVREAESLPGVLAELEQMRSDLGEQIARERELRDEIERRGAEITRLATQEGRLAGEVSRLVDEAARRRRAEEDARAEADALRTRQDEIGRDRDALAEDADRLRGELAAVRATVSWRVTSPLRAARHVLVKPVRLARSAVRRVRSATRRSPRPQAPEPVVIAADAAAADLDVQYYRRRNPDVAPLDEPDAALHFRLFGYAEGRAGTSIYGTSARTTRELREDRETVVVLFHDSTRTGAPVLGWNLLHELGRRYNTVAVLMDGGELVPAIEDVASATVHLDRRRAMDTLEADVFAERLRDDFAPVYAIGNSAATHQLASALERSGVPVVALVHEFASSMRPNGVLAEYYETVSEVVFPAQIVADSMRAEYAGLLARDHQVIPQGRSKLPPGGADQDHRARETPRGPDGVDADLPEVTASDLLGGLGPDTVLVLAAGTMAPRKGVEFFLQAAGHVRRTLPDADVRFAWIGHRVPAFQWYVEDVWEQVKRSGADNVTFVAPTPDMGPLYARTGVFLLSSRLDPLPNVAIDAALAGIPVVAFDQASGFADWLHTADLSSLVAPHLDGAAAGAVVARLVEDADERSRLGTALQAAAAPAFDMSTYVQRLDELGHAARASAERVRSDVEEIAASGEFDADLFAGPGADADLTTLVTRYVRTTRLAAPLARPRTGLLVRRPSDGFNPLVYAEQFPGFDDGRDGDPFADYLRKGRPGGPWVHDVIRPDDAYLPVAERAPLRVLVHGHFHYPELLPDLLSRLSASPFPVTLHLTTTSQENADLLRRALDEHGVLDHELTVVPNRGRDLGPLLTGLGWSVVREHDLLLHVHGKRSPHVDPEMSSRWSDFLWEHLVGGRTPMLDRIHAAFAADPDLGLVFPVDPHMNDWDLNREHAERLAPRLGLTTDLPNHFDFPVGNMYWARTSALRALFDAELTPTDFPDEPLPIDGTVLHALERLTPFVVRQAGFRCAKTAVPGIHR